MTDYSEHGAVPVDDAAVDDPPTVDEVAERQRIEHPNQARTARSPAAHEEAAAVEAGGQVVGDRPGPERGVEGPNSA